MMADGGETRPSTRVASGALSWRMLFETDRVRVIDRVVHRRAGPGTRGVTATIRRGAWIGEHNRRLPSGAGRTRGPNGPESSPR